MALSSARKESRRSRDERERFYLLPGQGGSGYRRKQRFILKAAIAVGIVVSVLFGVIMYLVYRPAW
jgi:hypothetical protein